MPVWYAVTRINRSASDHGNEHKTGRVAASLERSCVTKRRLYWPGTISIVVQAIIFCLCKILVENNAPSTRPPAWPRRQALWIYMRTQLVKRSCVDASLEIDHFVHRPPEFDPAPTIKLGCLTGIQLHAVLRRQKFQDKPALLLSDT